ncbi:MAG TPA: hypothetical protein VMX13_10135 [Sedimentisphaerales bacterium]|nr:hypothetical protein [Sedimentisphaerales bacterium]
MRPRAGKSFDAVRLRSPQAAPPFAKAAEGRQDRPFDQAQDRRRVNVEGFKSVSESGAEPEAGKGFRRKGRRCCNFERDLIGYGSKEAQRSYCI